MDIKTIYVQLLYEGTIVYRPMPAYQVYKEKYRLLKPDDYDPENEYLQFEPDTTVRCETKQLSLGQVLVAVELVI